MTERRAVIDYRSVHPLFVDNHTAYKCRCFIATQYNFGFRIWLAHCFKCRVRLYNVANDMKYEREKLSRKKEKLV
jgi:hypothetical protein